MPGWNESFFASKSVTFVAAAIAFLAAVVLFSIIFRFSFRRRLRLPRNGRARLPRLGTVDAFELDGQRQLVIVRRDNVEHLLMIGGPNDLVIESEIIRAESRDPRDLREARIRDKELREKEPRDVAPVPAGLSWTSPAEAPPPYPRHKMPFSPAAGLAGEIGLTAAVPNEDSILVYAPTTDLPAPWPPVFPLPPRRAAPPSSPPGQGTSNREPLQGGTDSAHKLEPGASPAKGYLRAPVATPFVRPPALRQVQGTAANPAPSSTPGPPPSDTPGASSLPGLEEISMSPEVDAAPQAVVSTASATQAAVSTARALAGGRLTLEATGPEQDGVDTLEEEMARLLGRAPR